MNLNPELIQYEQLGKAIFDRILANEDPGDIHAWLVQQVMRMGGAVDDDGALLRWAESFDLVDQMLAEYERLAQLPEGERQTLTWPWATWANLIDPLDEPGVLAVITAPDGTGKTIVAESLAEHWAAKKARVVFIHYELNKRLMMLRRTARNSSIEVRRLKSGELTSLEKRHVADIRTRLLAWDGYITYLHTPGWTMARTLAELRKLRHAGECDVVVLDYLEKVAPSQKQLQMFGGNHFQREADNVEMLKTFAESEDVPVVMVAQMSKHAKRQSFDQVDRMGMRGAGEKSEKANLVVMMNRERTGDGYSNEVSVLVDKNTMGKLGTFKQIMQPQFFRIGDIHDERII